MKTRLSKWFGAAGILSIGCSALLGEDFEGYRATCIAGRAACTGGSHDDPSPSGASEAGGSTGEPDAAILGGAAGAAGATTSAGEADATGGAAVAGAPGSVGDSGAAGESGTAGTAAGTTDIGGDASRGGTSGTAGTTAIAGSTGSPTNASPECQPDATIIPECALFSSGEDYQGVALNAASGIAMTSSEAYGGGFHVYASKRASPTIALNYTKDVEGTRWSSWFCLDALPEPDRLAAGSLLNGQAEVFATTGCGNLYRRTETEVYSWLPWQPFSLPVAGPAVTDVAMSVSANGTNLVYIVDAGRIFVRSRVGSDSYSSYGAWREIFGASEALLVTAGLRSDLRQQVFSLDARGVLRTSVQSTADLESAFGPWSDFDSSPPLAPLVDIEAPLGGPFPLELFAVDSNGALWRRAQDVATSDFQPWAAWDGPAPPTTLVSLAGAALKAAAGTPLSLTGLGAAGGVYTLRRTENVWSQWEQLR